MPAFAQGVQAGMTPSAHKTVSNANRAADAGNKNLTKPRGDGSGSHVAQNLKPSPTSQNIQSAPSDPAQTAPGTPNGSEVPTSPVNKTTGSPEAPGSATPAVPSNSASPAVPNAGELSTSPLGPPERLEDTRIIEGQAQESASRYLQGEAIELQLPKPAQLIPLGTKLPPIRLEAVYNQPVSLRDVLNYALFNNLDIRIQQTNVQSNRWLLIGQLGNFLPDTILNYRSQFQQGSSLVQGVIPVTFQTPFVTTSAGFRLYGFRGGQVLFNSLSQLHTFKAAKQQLRGSINDTLLAVAQAYYRLVENQALLQIQTRAVEVSKAQVLLNQQLQRAGTGTKFQVLQAETQLARDEQGLLVQEVGLRTSAINLATVLNLNAAVNLLSVESEVRKVRLIDPALDINQLIAIAILNRPELKQFEQLRLAARRQINAAAAPLYPQFNFFGTVTGTGATLSQKYAFVPGSFSDVPVLAPPPPGRIIDETQGAGLNPTGSTAQAVNPAANRTAVAAAEVFTPPTFISRQIRPSYTIGFQIDYNYSGLGVPTAANVQSNRILARQALLQSNQQLLNVIQQVRTSYLSSQTSERQIEVATKGVLSAAEELRLARVRLANGVGTNIDVINAQRDFTLALVTKAQAIINFNIAQAQLLRDVGLITVDNLTSGRLVRG
ncbi:MAG TPA: TolC family protein [Candidatus Obscuribacterales bacterium]